MTKTTDKKIISFLFLVVILIYGAVFAFTMKLAGNEQRRGVAEILPVYNGDSAGYVKLANNLLNYGVFSYTPANYQPETFRTPVFPAALAGFKGLSGGYRLFPLFQMILTAASACMIFSLGKKFFSRPVGAAAALIFILDPNTVYFSMVILSETLFVFLSLAAFYLMFGFERNSFALAGSGLLLGLATLTRPISVLLPVLFVLIFLAWNLLSHSKVPKKNLFYGSLIVLLCYAAVMLPWMSRNKVRTGVFGISSVSSSDLFAVDLPEYFAFRDGITADQGRAKMYAMLSANEIDHMAGLEMSARLNSLSFLVIKPELVSYAEFHILKSLPVFISSSLKTIFVTYNNVVGQEVVRSSTANFSSLLMKGKFSSLAHELVSYPAPAIEQIILGLVALLAFSSLFFKEKRLEAAGLLCVIFYFVLLTGPVADSRFRMPISPYVFLLASFSVYMIYGRIRAGLKFKAK